MMRKTEEREFIEMLGLLKEEAEGPNLVKSVMKKIKRGQVFNIFVKSLLLFPATFLLALISVRVISKTFIPAVIFSTIHFPEFALANPTLFVVLYTAAIGVYSAVLISVYTEGGSIDGALFLSSRQGSSGSLFEVRKTAL